LEHHLADLGDVRLHYVEAGSGPLVVLLHGFPEFWYSWRFQIPILAEAAFRVVVPDMRGYNLSDKPPKVGDYRVEFLGRDVERLIGACGSESAAVVGHDWGGVALAVTRIGTDGPDTLRGNKGDDNLIGKGGNDTLLSLAGHDTLLGGPGKDLVNGGSLAQPFAGNKNLVGGEGNDAVQGGLGSDNVLGGEGNDYMVDGEFDTPPVKDTLSGADGDDVLNVANKPAGKDVVSCGSGFDRVLADRADVVARDCEKVFIGPAAADEFFNSIPQSFIEGLPPQF
jgi:hypothetical protein